LFHQPALISIYLLAYGIPRYVLQKFNLSMSLGISDCIAMAQVILAACKCWSNTSTELDYFMTMVSDLKIRIEALAESREFESQILRPTEREFLCDWSLATCSILSEFQRTHHNEEHQIIQRLRWLCIPKLKPLSKKILGQIQSLNGFEQKLMLRSTT